MGEGEGESKGGGGEGGVVFYLLNESMQELS